MGLRDISLRMKAESGLLKIVLNKNRTVGNVQNASIIL
jgi:hypothetical protein